MMMRASPVRLGRCIPPAYAATPAFESERLREWKFCTVRVHSAQRVDRALPLVELLILVADDDPPPAVTFQQAQNHRVRFLRLIEHYGPILRRQLPALQIEQSCVTGEELLGLQMFIQRASAA
jgi:hypothetical protein